MYARKPLWGNIYQSPPTMTAADLLRLPDDGAKNELYEGELVREEWMSAGHSDLRFRLNGELGIYARKCDLAHRILVNCYFDLTPPGATKKTVLAPDLAIMRDTAALAWNSIPTAAPLLAVEVVSASQTLAELGLKAQFYRNAGVAEVWIIDHASRSVEIWTDQGVQTLNDTQMLTSALLPDFSLAIAQLLDG